MALRAYLSSSCPHALMLLVRFCRWLEVIASCRPWPLLHHLGDFTAYRGTASFAKAWETAIIEAEFPHASNINRSINSQRDNQILDTVRRFSEICFGRCSSRSLRHPESCFYSVKFSWCASAKKVRFEPCLFLARFQELLWSETLLFSTFKKRPFIWLVVATEYRS